MAMSPRHLPRRPRRASFLPAVFLLLGAPLWAQSLRALATARGVAVGTAVNYFHFVHDPAYVALLAREYNQVEPENAMKWAALHPAPQTYAFAQADAIVAFALKHQQRVRGHNLLWYSHNPAWLMDGHFTPTQLAQILQDHITTVVSHFAGRVYAWDVVNEAFQEGPSGKLRHSIWNDEPGIGRPGTGFIEQAFRWAHAVDPHALLFYNDFGIEAINPKSDAVYAMVRDFKRRGVPLDGLGLQMHVDTDGHPNLSSLARNIARFTALGVQVQITEMDVRLRVSRAGVASARDLNTQARIYHDISAVCLKDPGCTALQTWGFTDASSWIPRFYPGYGAALPFDADLRPKPAYGALANALGEPPARGLKLAMVAARRAIHPGNATDDSRNVGPQRQLSSPAIH